MRKKDEKNVPNNVIVLADFAKWKKKRQRARQRRKRVEVNVSLVLTQATYQKILKIHKKSRELLGHEIEDPEDVILTAVHHFVWSCDQKFSGLRILVVKPSKKKNKYRVVYAW